MVPWNCLTSTVYQEKWLAYMGTLVVLLLMNLTSWHLFMLTLWMNYLLQVVTQEMLLCMTLTVESAYKCSQICIVGILMSSNLQIIPHQFLLLHHLIMMSRCGTWDRNQYTLASLHQALEEMWWFAFLQMTNIF